MNSNMKRAVILITGLITAAIHLVVLNLAYLRAQGRPDLLFTLNGVGFLGLLLLYFIDLPPLQGRKNLVRYAFIAYTVLTIAAWIPIGERSLLGYATKLDEVILLVALFLEPAPSA
jgi:hypothetical protein